MVALSCISMFALAGCAAAPTPQDSQQKRISQEEAIAAVRALPEVREFESTLAASGSTARVDAQDEDAEWLVQVYEVKDDHTATFNWYRVDKDTGQASVEFP